MTDTDPTFASISRAADDLVPALSERLARHGLAEIEVTLGDLRLRVVRSGPPAGSGGTAAQAAAAAGSSPSAPPISVSSAPSPSTVGVTSPAVGFFVYAEGLGPGQEVAKGDALGHVEMLGVRHDVRAPRGGTVRHLVAETGEAVEYGQVVVELEGAEAALR